MRLKCLCMAFPSKSTGSLPGTKDKDGPSSSKSSFFSRFKKHKQEKEKENNQYTPKKSDYNNNRANAPPPLENLNIAGSSSKYNNGISNNTNSEENARRVAESALHSPTTASVPHGALSSPPKTKRQQTQQQQQQQQSQPKQEEPPPEIALPPLEPPIKPVSRIDSEKRSKLMEIKPTREEQRALSVDPKRIRRLSGQFDYRHTSASLASPRGSNFHIDPRDTSTSLRSPRATVTSIHDPRASFANRRESRSSHRRDDVPFGLDLNHPPLSPATDIYSPTFEEEDERYQEMIEEELEWRWILNLSMHFRERSDREKFFVTYAENPRLRHRLTVSCDYRHAEPGSLEEDLKNIPYQREKSARIYDAVRDSLLDIQFYPTITNLKLETKDGRLHVHVNEDINEIIHYPPVNFIRHLHCDLYTESELDFDCHLSGFVYKVRSNTEGGRVFIKKEIPGPDTIDEFLYEINALHALRHSSSVIRFGGLVVDERRKHVKGLLISYAPNGSLIDVIYNERGKLPWKKRERWARQIVTGLSEIHEEGFVQGDFTMSNMVLDENDDIKIIDINRRGCPIGWEPPEMKGLIQTSQRISMFIGVKSDLYQLGMVLWGLVYQVDEPEQAARPLDMAAAPDEVPEWFKGIVMACLSDHPRGRPSARELLYRFPDEREDEVHRPIDVVVGDGQVVHVTSSSTSPSGRSMNSNGGPGGGRPGRDNGSPTSLRINAKNARPLMGDLSPSKMHFVESPSTMSPAIARAFDALNGKVNGIGLNFPNSSPSPIPSPPIPISYRSEQSPYEFPNGFAPSSPPGRFSQVPESPATDCLASSPPVKDDGTEFSWEGYKVERISDPNAGGEVTMTYRIESLEEARREIANSISSHRNSKRVSVSSAELALPDTGSSILEKRHSNSNSFVGVGGKPAFGRFDSGMTAGEYETPSEEFPPQAMGISVTRR